MSHASATIAPTALRDRGKTVGELLGAPSTRVMIAGLAIGLIALFYNWFLKQNKHSFGNEDWSHAYIVPLISGYVLWRSRERIEKLRPEIFWPGALPLAMGVACYYFFTVGYSNHMFQGFSLVLTIFGIVLLLLGPRMLPLVTFPIAYLGFGVTIAEMVMLKVTARLQEWASWGSHLLLNIIGFTTERLGNTLTIITDRGEFPLNVADACSGMRMVVAFFALGAAVAFLSCKHWWQRIALLMLVGPIAIFVNVLRVTTLGIASVYNAELSKGEAHMFIGVLWLLPAFLLFMSVVWALNKMVHEESPASSPEGKVQLKKKLAQTSQTSHSTPPEVHT